MKQRPKLKKYVELFKRNISKFLADGVSVKANIYPVSAGGAVLEFLLNKDRDDSDSFLAPRFTVAEVMTEIPQKMISGKLENVQFSGTNLYLEGNRIIVIKGDDFPESWQGNAVRNDVMRAVMSSQGSKVS